ncbi:hypothetical protein H0H87_007588, partial [Tephrocybe sp. NHM501043]
MSLESLYSAYRAKMLSKLSLHRERRLVKAKAEEYAALATFMKGLQPEPSHSGDDDNLVGDGNLADDEEDDQEDGNKDQGDIQSSVDEEEFFQG